MAIQVKDIPSYVEALNKTSLQERDSIAYQQCLDAILTDIEGDVVYFRYYLSHDLDYWLFCFSRKDEVKFEYTSYKEGV